VSSREIIPLPPAAIGVRRPAPNAALVGHLA